jgi:adenylate cyclase
MIRRPSTPTLIALAGGFLAAAWSVFLAAPHLAGWRSPIDALEATLADLRVQIAGPSEAPADIVILAIDDATLAEEGGGFPYPRARLAEIIRQVVAARPKALAVDILLVDAKDAFADRGLADALSRVPTVIAAAGRFTGARNVSGLPQTGAELWPMPVFASVATVGLVNVVTDASGTPRHIPLLYFTSRGLQSSLVLKAASLYLGAQPEIGEDEVRIGTRAYPMDLGFHMPLRSLGPSGTVRTVSARDLLAGQDLDALTGRMVVLGFTATAVGDSFVTPFDPVTPGVEVLAAGLAQLIGGEGLVRTDAIRRFDVLAAAVLAIGGVATIAFLPVALGVSVATAALALWLVAVCVLFAHGFWFSAALPLAASLPPLIGASLARHLYERRIAGVSSRAAEALRHFHPPALADRIANDPTFLLEPVTQHLAIFFVDLAGFTHTSEAIGLAGTRDLLKRFHSCVAQEVGGCGGVVLNYMGDGAIAAFGLPEPRRADAENALRAAFALVLAGQQMAFPPTEDAAPGLRIGLHYGPAVISRLGHDAHQQITISGDSVNLASRLMEVAKAEAATIAASDDLLAAMSADPQHVPDARRTVAIRGRVAQVEVALWRAVPAA